ncbi:MAG: FtsX-like permease family protein [Chitinivibrionales bacterium]|nr:FtsX-like permease family protein [Chitinivibrionales bacterium]
MIFLKLAWRNMFRNKRRTFIAGSAIGIGLASLIFTDAMIIGMQENMIRSGTAPFLGEAQIHAEGFRATREVENTINNTQSVLHELENDTLVDHSAPRAMGIGMVTSPANLGQVVIWGIDPEKERYLSKIDDAIVEGEYLDTGDKRQILIGKKLAERLEVGTGDRVVATLAKAKTGELSQELFRVGGIYHFNIDEFDKGMAFVTLNKAQDMLGIGDDVHEIAIDLAKGDIVHNKDHPFWDKYSRHGNETAGWPELLPQFSAILQMTDLSLIILAVILFGVVALGIINTLFMSLYERMFEFGVMRAVGTRPFALWRMVVYEACSLAVLSSILGIVLGFGITYIVSKTGIDYRGIEFSGVTIQELIYPQLTVSQFIIYPVFVLIFTGIVGMYPATYAARLNAAEAMRRSL